MNYLLLRHAGWFLAPTAALVLASCASGSDARPEHTIEERLGDVVVSLSFSEATLPDSVAPADVHLTVDLAEVAPETDEARTAAIVVNLEPTGLAFASPATLRVEHAEMPSVVGAVLLSGGEGEPATLMPELGAAAEGRDTSFSIPHFSTLLVVVTEHRISPRLLEIPTRPIPIGTAFTVRVAVDHHDWEIESELGEAYVARSDKPVRYSFRARPAGSEWIARVGLSEGGDYRARRLSPSSDSAHVTVPTSQSAVVGMTFRCERAGEFGLVGFGSVGEDTVLHSIEEGEVSTWMVRSQVSLEEFVVFGECVAPLIDSPTAGRVGAPGDSATPQPSGERVAIDVMVINGERIPTEQLEPVAPHAGCMEWHWHLSRPALTLEGGEVLDPNSAGCGFGTFLGVEDVEVSFEAWSAYRDRLAGTD